jgi:hypothetical protein
MRLLLNSSYIFSPLRSQRTKNLTEGEQPHLFYNPIWKKFFQDTILYSNHQCFISIRQRTLSLTIEPFNTGASLSSNFLSYDMEIVSTGAALVFYLAIWKTFCFVLCLLLHSLNLSVHVYGIVSRTTFFVVISRGHTDGASFESKVQFF